MKVVTLTLSIILASCAHRVPVNTPVYRDGYGYERIDKKTYKIVGQTDAHLKSAMKVIGCKPCSVGTPETWKVWIIQKQNSR